MKVTVTGNASAAEERKYIDYLEGKYNRKLESLEINLDGDFADLKYKFAPVSFERIRRITGYLVGTMDNWNNAKTSEEAARVKHSLNNSTFEDLDSATTGSVSNGSSSAIGSASNSQFAAGITLEQL